MKTKLEFLMDSVSLYELFLVLIIGQCIFLIFTIQFIPKRNTGPNKIIQSLLFIFSLYLIERIFFNELEVDFLKRYGYLINLFYLVIGPLIYTYVRRLLFYENGNYQLGYYHYFPALLYLAYCLFHIFIFDSIQDSNEYFVAFLFWNEIIFFISITAYLLKSWGLFNYYIKNEEQELSFNQTILKYVKVMLICMSIYMLFWLLGIFERFLIKLPINIEVIYEISCLIFVIQINVVGLYSLIHPEVFQIRFPAKRKKESAVKNMLNEAEISNIQHLLHEFFQDKKGYRRPELSLSILANEINTSTNKLSWVLNNRYKKTFYEFVNEYRVKDFSRRIRENNHKEYTVIAIANEVGFSSKSTFYKAFKEITGFTPTEYIKRIEAEKNA